MKTFKFKMKSQVKVLTAVALALSFAGFLWNVFNLVEATKTASYMVVSYAIICVLTLALSVFILSILLNCKYRITKDLITCSFGFYTGKIKVKDVTAITHFKKSDTLVIYFLKDKYSVVVIEPKCYGEFTAELLKLNNKIDYQTSLDELE